MPFFHSAQNRERMRRYDVWTERTWAALSDETIRQALGDLGTGLLPVHRSLFLPDVRHGEVRVPRRYLRTDGAALLPRLSEDGVLVPHDTLLQPTPTRRQKITQALAAGGKKPPTEKHLGTLVRSTLAGRDNPTKHIIINPGPGSASAQVDHLRTDITPRAVLDTRPVVTLSPEMPTAEPWIDAATGVHELTHVLDANRRASTPHSSDPYYKPFTEVRGYLAASIVLDAAVKKGRLSLEDALADEVTWSVEQVAAEYSVSAGLVHSDSFTQDQMPDDLACDLVLLGTIRL
ncbi:MAG TPA: hypothetical protein VLF71_03880 [Candidatus Saccharimonadales bacterium]|nr:hypothetical protein [Candidatus Saccharimonadales bacterium]